MAGDDSDGRLSVAGLVAGTALGVYLLVVAGATAAIADAAAACPTWPTCGGRWLVPLSRPDAVVAMLHRAVALVVGVLVAATAAVGWRRGATRRVRYALAAAAVAYPVQVALGAVTATERAPTALSAAHLAAGMGIFGALVVGLAWQLEAETADGAGDTPTDPDGTGESLVGTSPGDSAGNATATPGDTNPTPEGTDPTPGDTDPIPGDATTPVSTRRTLAAYLGLLKPRLMWLLCLVAGAGMALAASGVDPSATGPGLSVRTVVATMGGGVLAIGASGTFNHVLERDVDRRMERTADRPLAADVVPVRNAVALGVALAAGAVGAFLTLNVLAAALGLAAILFYSVVYTVLLKPNTDKNTVIGGAAGAFPALIGWAAVTGGVGPPALLLAAVVFLWTPAHFYNLALAYQEDYERGGFPMLPVVRGEATTRKHVLVYLGATLGAAAVLTAATGLGPLFAGTSVALGGVFLWAVVRLHRERTRGAALRAFHASNAYLGAVLVAVVVDALVT